MTTADRNAVPMRRLPIGRLVAWTIAAGLLGTGGYYLVEAHRMDRKVDLAADAEPLRMKVDLSRPGRYEDTYHQTYMGAHGASLEIHLGPAPAGRPQPGSSPATEPTTQLAAGFEGQVQIFDSTGKRVYDADLTADDLGFLLVRPGRPRPEWPRFRLPAGLPLGTYRLVLDVRQPAAGLAGRSKPRPHSTCSADWRGCRPSSYASSRAC